MALITCPECGKRFSSFAKACPECAYPLTEKDLNEQLKKPVSDNLEAAAEIVSQDEQPMAHEHNECDNITTEPEQQNTPLLEAGSRETITNGEYTKKKHRLEHEFPEKIARVEKFDNNRDEYRTKCTLFTGLMAGLLVVLCWVLYSSMLQDVPDGWAFLFIAVVSAILFTLWQLADMHTTLGIPDKKADKIAKKQMAHDWSIKYGVSFGSVYAGTMIIGTLSNGDLAESLPAIVFGCSLLGFVAYVIALVVATVLAPKEYLPWLTQEGYRAYLRREEKRREEAANRAKKIEASLQHSPLSPAPTPSIQTTNASSSSAIKGRIYQGQFSGAEMGYYTKDTIYKTGTLPFSDTKLGKYSDGMIDDDSGIVFAHTIGRYRWDSVYNGYLLYEGNTQDRFIGRVLRNGEIQAAKHPDYGPLGNLISSIEYKTVGRYSGDPEGAAAAAYLLLFR